MKKVLYILILTFIFTSCGKSNGEKMLYDYQQKNAKSMNFDLKDLDFKIEKIEKIANIKASDSAKLLKNDLAELWSENPEQVLIDTLSFGYVKNILSKSIEQNDTLYKLYQESVLKAIKFDDFSWELESKNKRDNALDEKYSLMKTLANVEFIENKFNLYSKKPDSILSVKYFANYSLINPMLSDTKQTFEKFFYTNPTQTEFIKEANE